MVHAAAPGNRGRAKVGHPARGCDPFALSVTKLSPACHGARLSAPGRTL